MLACGMDAKGVMAELTGRRGGYSKGKGGSMHMFSVEKGFFGGHGIVGAQVPLGTGLAFANKYRGNDNVSLTYFGDGAANQGQVYESFNMAKLWKLPVVYIIENNQYGMGTSVDARVGDHRSVARAGSAHGIPGEQVDGMDVRAVKAAGDKAVKWCRDGNGPIILEMLTYRYRGHSMSDPAKYRTKEEVDKYRTEHDPIEQVRARLLAKKWAQRGRVEEDRRRGARASSTRRRSSPPTTPSPILPSSTPTCTPERDVAWRSSHTSWPVLPSRARSRAGSSAPCFYVADVARDLRDEPERGLDVACHRRVAVCARRLQGAAAAHAAKVNKALVAFFACLMVAVAAISVATNLARVSR